MDAFALLDQLAVIDRRTASWPFRGAWASFDSEPPRPQTPRDGGDDPERDLPLWTCFIENPRR